MPLHLGNERCASRIKTARRSVLSALPPAPQTPLLLNAVLLVAVLLVLAAQAQARTLRVVVTIKPVHSLVAAVMSGVGEPALLVRGAGSPHHYALRPSDARALASADVVVRVGAHLEPFLDKPLRSLASGARLVTLAEAPGMTLLPLRRGGDWGGGDAHEGRQLGSTEHGSTEHGSTEHGSAESSAEHDAAHNDPDHESTLVDPHLWLSPDNAGAMLLYLAQVLAEADPLRGSTYRANAEATRREIALLDARLAVRLASSRERPAMVYHDGYQYFERHYGLRVLGAVTLSPEQSPGARRVTELRGRLHAAGVVCLFGEPQFPPRLLRTLTEGSSVRTAFLDPLGAELTPGASLYVQLLETLATALVGCLSAP